MRLADVPLWLIGLVLALLWITPFIWMISTSLKPTAAVMSRDIRWIPRPASLENYRTVFAEAPVARWLLNSMIVAVVATAFSVLLGAMAGFALARLHFPGRRLLFFVLLASLMIPTELSVVPLYVAFLEKGLVNSHMAMILPSVASVFSVYLYRQFFLGLPQELEDAATIDGSSHFGFFRRIALPLAKAPTLAAVVLLFTANWNAFLWPLLIVFEEGMKTMPVGMAEFAPGVGSHTQLTSFGPAMAGVTLLAVPSLLLFLVLQRYFIEGVARVGVKG